MCRRDCHPATIVPARLPLQTSATQRRVSTGHQVERELASLRFKEEPEASPAAPPVRARWTGDAL
jgi:hypothetical protein